MILKLYTKGTLPALVKPKVLNVCGTKYYECPVCHLPLKSQVSECKCCSVKVDWSTKGLFELLSENLEFSASCVSCNYTFFGSDT